MHWIPVTKMIKDYLICSQKLTAKQRRQLIATHYMCQVEPGS